MADFDDRGRIPRTGRRRFPLGYFGEQFDESRGTCAVWGSAVEESDESTEDG